MKNKFKFALKTKVIWLNVVLLTFFASLLVYFVYNLTVNELTRSKQETTRVVIEGQAKTVDFALSKSINSVKELAGNEQVVNYFDENLIKPRAADLINLFKSVSLSRQFSNIYLLNKNGDVVLSVDPSFLNNNFSFRDYFKKAMQGNNHMQIAFGVLTKKPGYYFSAPILSNHNVVGVIVIKQEVSYINSLFDNSPTSKIGHYFLTDENGIVISTDKKIDEYQSLGSISEEKLKQIRLERRFDGFGLKPLQYQIVQDSIENYVAPISFDYFDKEDGDGDDDGELELLQVQKVGDTPFFLVTESSMESIFGQIKNILWPIIYLIGGSVVLGLLTQYFFLTKLFKPLSILEKYSSRVASGESVEFATLKTSDELESLSQSVGTMVKSLREAKRNSDEEVRRKTELLSRNLEELGRINSDQNQSQTAMLNVLEDSKTLENQLAEEKKSVEQKVAERTKQLAEEQARLKSSILALPQAFVIVDKSLNFVTQNGKLEYFFGKSDNIWDLKTIDSYLGKEMSLLEKIKESIEFLKVFDIPELAHGFKFLRIYIAPVLDDSGSSIGAILILQDVTEEKILNRSKDEFFSIASHELRTPLTAIRGNSEMIIENYVNEIKNPDIKEMVEDIHEGSLRLIEIVNDFLNISRLEMKKIEFKNENIDLKKVIEDTIGELKNTDIKTNKYLNFDVPEWDMNTICDKDKIKQVIINLVGNGLKFTEKGGVTVKVKQSQDSIDVSVVDTGRGIPADQQKLLFRKFQQAGSSLYTRDTTKGTGLGLYISKLLMEGMGGSIWLESSEEGRGSVFTFRVPKA
jgi:signal transduction histidine kinase/HAMP domain-containing protein